MLKPLDSTRYGVTLVWNGSEGEDGQESSLGKTMVCKGDFSRWVSSSSWEVVESSSVHHGEFLVNIVSPVPDFITSVWPIVLFVQNYQIVDELFCQLELL